MRVSRVSRVNKMYGRGGDDGDQCVTDTDADTDADNDSLACELLAVKGSTMMMMHCTALC